MATRIGTNGEDPPSLFDVVASDPDGYAEDLPPAPDFPEFVVDPLPELPWAAPAPPSVLGLVPVAEDAPPEGDPEPDPTEAPEPFGTVAPPLLEDLAGEPLECVGEVGWPPVALGTTVSY